MCAFCLVAPKKRGPHLRGPLTTDFVGAYGDDVYFWERPVDGEHVEKAFQVPFDSDPIDRKGRQRLGLGSD